MFVFVYSMGYGDSSCVIEQYILPENVEAVGGGKESFYLFYPTLFKQAQGK